MREIYIIPKMQKIFDEVKKINTVKGYDDDDYIFVDQNGRIKTTLTASYLYRLCDKLNIPRRGIHSIRKTVISKMIDEAVHNKKSLEEVRRISGDNTIDMLLKHYYYSLQDKSETEDFMVEALSW